MKQFFLGLSFSGVFILGCLTATYAPEVASPTAKAGTGEGRYKCGQKVDSFSGTKGAYVAKLEASLNAQGGPGWRLALHGDGVVCFERIDG